MPSPRDKSSENTSFSYLRGSSDFLNLVLNNINTCVLLLDEDMKLCAFNDAMKALFTRHPGEQKLYMRCGEALGCAAHVEEGKDCGSTTKCCDCILRQSALLAYSDGASFHKNQFSREFFNVHGKKEMKHLQFSTRCIDFQGDRYILLLVEDQTDFIEQAKLIEDLKEVM